MFEWDDRIFEALDPERPVLIAGPTASGKSALAMRIAEKQGGVLINADALQVFSNWRILTARPTEEDEARVAHRLYGHVPGTHAYSVGDWLREVSGIWHGPLRPIVVGGTGLYFSALTEGLADIPSTPAAIRALADRRISAEGSAALLDDLDPLTRARIDCRNPARVQRAWEVQKTTGRGLAEWHEETDAPLAPLDRVQPLLLDADRDWLISRIRRRFHLMLDAGLLDEGGANVDDWSPDMPAAKAIGAAEVIAHLQGRLPFEEMERAVVIQTRQYAKRQRTWFRRRMRDWRPVACH